LVVAVRPCPHGRGLFARADIPKGSVIQEFKDVVFTPQPTRAREGKFALRVGENEYWDGFPHGSPDFWSNFIDHDDNPNAVFVFDKERRRARLKAAKAIKKDQEIFLRYDSYYPTNPRFGPFANRPLP
jgi:SET domain-containing protein